MSHAATYTDRHLDRLVLIKTLADGIDQERLLDEVTALSAVRSKHVVQIYDVIRDGAGEIVGLVEEFLEGADLDSRLPIKDRTEFLKTAYAIACGLADIHAAGLVHRDIKPNNMKFDGEGCLKIFDFGLSRPDTADAKTTGTIGTPGYLAPELCVEDWEDVEFSQPVDVFAYGATAFKLLRGTLPPELRALPPKLPSPSVQLGVTDLSLELEVVEILNRCLALRPSQRPRISEVRDLLAAHLLRDKHRATLVVGQQSHVLNSQNRTVRLGGSNSSATIEYNGLQFYITSTKGIVAVNNIPVTCPYRLPGSCVLLFGDPNQGSRPQLTIDVSHPEVVL